MGCPQKGTSQKSFSGLKVEASSIEPAEEPTRCGPAALSGAAVSSWDLVGSIKCQWGVTWDAQECFTREFQHLNLSGRWATPMLRFAWYSGWQGSFGPVKGPYAAWTRWGLLNNSGGCHGMPQERCFTEVFQCLEGGSQ